MLPRGHTKFVPVIKQTGNGETVNTMSSDSVQPLVWSAVKRKVAVAEKTWAVVMSEEGESIVAVPDTTVHIVEAIGFVPAVAAP